MDVMDAHHPRNLWEQAVYARFLQKIDPFRDRDFFRPLTRAYTGDNTFWSTPSPEPDLPAEFWALVKKHLDDATVQTAARRLAAAIARWEPDPSRIVFAAILRAGVPVADWLCRLLPGAQAVALSLFVGLGIDQVALRRIQQDFPERNIIFVDGWTGRGGVSRTVAALNAGPLAVLNDPWGWADFSGCDEDIFCPTACFTGAATLGFSRTFFIDEDTLFGTYRFPRQHCRPDLVTAWQRLCPPAPSAPVPGRLPERFHRETDLRLHSNEVCRALINAAPETLYFRDDMACVRKDFPLLLALAERRKVKILTGVKELAEYRTRAACSLHIET